MKISSLFLILLSINLVACLGEKGPETPETPETPVDDGIIGSAIEGCDKPLASISDYANVYGDFQHVYNDCIVGDENKHTLTIKYRSNDDNTTGIGLRVHYNSSQLIYSKVVEKLETDLIVDGSVSPDNDNDDNDESTDRVILLGWASLNGIWPGEEEANLATIEFTQVDSSDEDYIINYTDSSNAADFDLLLGK